jgi:hypothetical protein
MCCESAQSLELVDTHARMPGSRANRCLLTLDYTPVVLLHIERDRKSMPSRDSSISISECSPRRVLAAASQCPRWPDLGRAVTFDRDRLDAVITNPILCPTNRHCHSGEEVALLEQKGICHLEICIPRVITTSSSSLNLRFTCGNPCQWPAWLTLLSGCVFAVTSSPAGLLTSPRISHGCANRPLVRSVGKRV